MPRPEYFWYCIYCHNGPHDWRRYSHCIECGRLRPVFQPASTIDYAGNSYVRESAAATSTASHPALPSQPEPVNAFNIAVDAENQMATDPVQEQVESSGKNLVHQTTAMKDHTNITNSSLEEGGDSNAIDPAHGGTALHPGVIKMPQTSDPSGGGSLTNTTASPESSTSETEYGDEDIEVFLASRKHKLLETLMRDLYEHLCKRFGWAFGGHVDCTGEGPPDRSTRGQDGQISAQSACDHTVSSTTKRAARATSPRSGDDEDEDREPKRRKGSSKPQHQDMTRRFACPFFKHDPIRYCGTRSCMQPGFKTVSRVKEHIFRCHQPKIQCRRCLAEFRDEIDLEAHSRSDGRCDKKLKTELESMSTKKLELIRSKRRYTKDDPGEEGKWRDIYRILFPGAEIPCPYHESPSMTIQADLPLNSQDVPSFESFLRNLLPQRVEDEVRSVIQERFQPIEDDLRNTIDIAGIVETHIEELTRSWRDRRSPTGLLGETLPEQNDDIFLGDHGYPALPASIWEAEADLLTESIPDVVHRGNEILDGPSPGNLGNIAVNDQLWGHSYPALATPIWEAEADLLTESIPDVLDRGNGLLDDPSPGNLGDIAVNDQLWGHSYPALPTPIWEAEADLLTESIPDVLDRGNRLLDDPSPGNLGDIAVNDQLWDFLPVPPESDISEHTEQFEGQYKRLPF